MPKALPDVSSLATEEEVLAVRSSLPKAKTGDLLQGYKWSLTVRLRSIRAKRGGPMSAAYVRKLMLNAGDTCPMCANQMRPWINGRYPTIDHIVALAKGGTNANENLRVICNRCNSQKADRAGQGHS